jgi:glycosyltransferase involved in cell wall biosynthesis
MEAMSMGKAVVATRSVGQSDVLNDRRSTTRSRFHRVASGTFLKMFGTRDIDNLQTGFYVNPGEVDEMYRGVKYLLENPERAANIGRNAREVIVQTMTLEHFCKRIKSVVTPELESTEANEKVYLGIS